MRELKRVDLDRVITERRYFQVPDTQTTICAITTQSGVVVTGSSDEIGDRILGQSAAYQNALGKLWILENYHLKSKDYEAGKYIEKASTWQGQLRADYRHMYNRTRLLYGFLKANPYHDAAAVLRKQYRAQHKLLCILHERVEEMDYPVMDIPPMIYDD